MFTKDDYERISSVDLRTSPLQSDCASANLLKGVPAGARLSSFHGGYAIVYGINVSIMETEWRAGSSTNGGGKTFVLELTSFDYDM